MTLEENKALVTQFVDEFWNSGDESALDRLMAKDVTLVVNGDAVPDTHALAGFARSLRGAFPDWHSEVEELVGENDVVAERWTGHGTHRGDFQGIRATGSEVAVPGTVFYRVAAGKIVEFRGQFDRMSMMQQLGAAPQPAHVGASA